MAGLRSTSPIATGEGTRVWPVAGWCRGGRVSSRSERPTCRLGSAWCRFRFGQPCRRQVHVREPMAGVLVMDVDVTASRGTRIRGPDDHVVVDFGPGES